MLARIYLSQDGLLGVSPLKPFFLNCWSIWVLACLLPSLFLPIPFKYHNFCQRRFCHQQQDRETNPKLIPFQLKKKLIRSILHANSKPTPREEQTFRLYLVAFEELMLSFTCQKNIASHEKFHGISNVENVICS